MLPFSSFFSPKVGRVVQNLPYPIVGRPNYIPCHVSPIYSDMKMNRADTLLEISIKYIFLEIKYSVL